MNDLELYREELANCDAKITEALKERYAIIEKIMAYKEEYGMPILQPEQEEKQVYQSSAAHEMTNILEGVLTRGTAHGNAISGMPCAGKTGTTNDNLDGWFVGYTGYYTTGVWVGFDSPRSAKALSGASYPLAIWNTYMTELHQGLTSKALND